MHWKNNTPQATKPPQNFPSQVHLVKCKKRLLFSFPFPLKLGLQNAINFPL